MFAKSTTIDAANGLDRTYLFSVISSFAPLAEVPDEEAVWRSAVQFGDRVTVVTLNSVYTLIAVEDDRFIISGGWFERQNASPSIVYVAGCTCGGSAINRKLVAAPRLRLELGNGVVTTEIQRVIFEPLDSAGPGN